MQYSNKRRMLLSMGLGALAWGGFAKAQTASGQTLRVVVPYPPGGVVDPTARLMAAPLSAAAGRPIVIENRPGAAGAIGISAVAQARPDGNTLLFHSSTVTTSATVTYENSSKEVQSLLAPVAMIGIAPFLIVVHPAVPVNSMQELLAYARANPGKLNYGSAGRGSSNHLAAELFKRMANVQITHVPFQGGGPAVTALLGGQIEVGFDTISGSGTLVKAGRLRALAVTGMKRNAALPNVPTVNESGVPNYDVGFWVGYFAPKDTPADVINKLAEAVREASAKPEVVSRMADMGLEHTYLSPQPFNRLFQADIEKWRDLQRYLGA